MLFALLAFSTNFISGATTGRPVEFVQYRGAAAESAFGELRCRLASGSARFDESLAQAKWSSSSIPTIDWAKHETVIVAPQAYIEGYRPRIQSVTYDEQGLLITWKFVEEAPDVAPEIRRNGVSTHGSRVLGPEVIIAEISKDERAGKPVRCHGPKKIDR
ncbi:MAG TPA: hypothetical protein VJ724_01120 [Tahibacter sp.]|nr:hypothetical protein [Tahibacter sp.]